MRRPSGARTPGASVVAVAVGLFVVLVTLGGLGVDAAPAAPAQAEPDAAQPAAEGESLTWSVRPTPTADEPERPNYSYDLGAGATVRDSIRVRNFGDEPLPLAIYASDALTTPTGALDLLPAGEQPTDVGAWIVLDTVNVDIPPQGFVDVGFTMVVPPDADSGDHTGGIVTSFRAPGTDAEGQPVVLDRRLGTRVYVRVDGELTPELSVSEVEVSYDGTTNPVGTGDVHVSYLVTNTGNVRLRADQRVAVPGRLGFPGREAMLEPMPELLPGSSLRFSVDIADVWPAFRTTAEVVLDPVSAREGDDLDVPQATKSASTWSVPWGQLVVALVVVGVPLAVWRSLRRRANRQAALTAQVTQTATIVTEAVKAALAAQSGKPDGGVGTEDAGAGEEASDDDIGNDVDDENANDSDKTEVTT